MRRSKILAFYPRGRRAIAFRFPIPYNPGIVDPTKLRLPISLVIAALSIAAGAGGTAALARVQQAETAATVETHAKRLESLEHESQANRERVLRIEILSEQTNKAVDRLGSAVDRIERKLGR